MENRKNESLVGLTPDWLICREYFFLGIVHRLCGILWYLLFFFWDPCLVRLGSDLVTGREAVNKWNAIDRFQSSPTTAHLSLSHTHTHTHIHTHFLLFTSFSIYPWSYSHDTPKKLKPTNLVHGWSKDNKISNNLM